MYRKIISLLVALVLLTGILAAVVYANFIPNNDNIVSNGEVHRFTFDAVYSEEWQTMSRARRVEVSQIPEDIKANMTTEELFRTVMSYPFLPDIMAFNSPRLGFLVLYDEFPALGYLISRHDFGSVAISFYESVPGFITRGGGGSLLRLSAFETILAQPEVKNALTEYEIYAIFEIAEQRFNERMELIEEYGSSTFAYIDALFEQGGIIFERFSDLRYNN